MSDPGTVDLMLIRAAANGQLEYRHTDAAAKYMFLWNGAAVDMESMKRIAALIGDHYLSIASLGEDCPVEVTAEGNLAALRGALR